MNSLTNSYEIGDSSDDNNGMRLYSRWVISLGDGRIIKVVTSLYGFSFYSEIPHQLQWEQY